MTDPQSTGVDLTPAQLTRWASVSQDVAVAEARTTGSAAGVARALADHVLEVADHEPAASAAWLAVADALLAAQNTPIAAGQVLYARARLAMVQGDPHAAERALVAAQSAWRQADDPMLLVRSHLGLTQVLAVQGRFDDAMAAAHQALDGLQALFAVSSSAASSSTLLRALQVRAWRNLGTLHTYRDEHELALPAFDAARAVLRSANREDPAHAMAAEDNPQDAQALARQDQVELAHIELNRAGALTFLDRIGAAQAALQAAVTAFDGMGDLLNRGRARTNLARLHLRTGRFVDALSLFEAAAHDLMGDSVDLGQADLLRLRQADELLLEWSLAYVALNLLPEAAQTLTRCGELFADQPYELAQTRYTQGLLALRTGPWALAQRTLTEALALYRELQNRYWTNRTMLALARLALLEDDAPAAMQWLDLLAGPAPAATEANIDADAKPGEIASPQLLWDAGTLADFHILQIDLAVLQNDPAAVAAARARLDAAFPPDAVAVTGVDEAMARYRSPDLQLRVAHARGRAAMAVGDRPGAQRHFWNAVNLLEEIRTSLPLEEIRTAFLLDKSALYVDLLRTYLPTADAPDPDRAADDEIAGDLAVIFEIVERARSRALLERLQLLMADDAVASSDPTHAARVADVRNRLHWLYNQLLGGDETHGGESGETPRGNRRTSQLIAQELQAQELLLHRLDRRPEVSKMTLGKAASPLGAVTLAAFQAALGPTRQAISFFMAGDEIIALVISATTHHLVRHVCTRIDLLQAMDEFHFQLGRVEIRAESHAGRALHLRKRVQRALGCLYQLLIDPLAALLHAPNLLWLPHGLLHQVPFHALWDGEEHLAERFVSTYAPSAGVAMECWAAQATGDSAALLRSFAGVAIRDVTIPAARREVTAAAGHFPAASLFLDEAATRAGLTAAAQADGVLHIATHGLFRSDNPFFSALKLADGWIDVRDLYRLPLRAQLVVLSACESGAGYLGDSYSQGAAAQRGLLDGGDEFIGLARGFLGAGAPTLVVSQWAVHDASAADLMEAFYEQLLVGHPPALALQGAQRAAIAAGTHPYFWGGFQVIG